MSTLNNPTIEVFYSYSHLDEELRIQLEKHLSLLRRQGAISGWHDRRIGAGTEWAGQIDDHLNDAHVILLLISSDFLASDYCYDVEMTRALERHDSGEALVIPVILRAADWQTGPFSKLQALPKDAKPVTSWDNRDEAFTDVARGIRAAVEELARLGKQLIAGTLIAGVLFLLFPAALGFERTLPDVIPYDRLFGVIFNIDHPHNLVPSLHVVFSTCILLAISDRAKGWFYGLLMVWLIAIMASTLLVHQHHLLDIIAGLGLTVMLRKYYRRVT